MGMFDTVKSSFDLGEEFTNTQLQTKGLMCAMNDYWISPSGELFLIDESPAVDVVFDDSCPWTNLRWEPNGNHGKITPKYITDYIEVYPAQWEGSWQDWPTCGIYFKNGKIVDWGRINNKNDVCK